MKIDTVEYIANSDLPSFCRDMDDNTSLEDMSFEMTIHPERGSLTSVNSTTTTCTTDSSGSGHSATKVSLSFRLIFLWPLSKPLKALEVFFLRGAFRALKVHFWTFK